MTYCNYSYKDTNKKFIFDLMEFIYIKSGMDCFSSVLSIGCGIGIHEDILDKFLCNKVVRLNNVDKYNAEKDKIPYEDDSFDFVFIKSVIEHIKNTDLFLSEIRRVLKPEGKVICLTPDFQKQKDFFFDDYTHVRPFTKVSLNMAFLLNSFKIEHCDWFFYYKAIWEGKILPNNLPVRIGFLLTKLTGIKYFRWGSDRQIFVIGRK